MSEGNPFSPLRPSFERYNTHEAKAERWEVARLQWLMQRLALQYELKELKRQNDGKALFRDFNAQFTTFPFHLVSEALTDLPPIDTDPKSFHPLWFTSFASMPFIKKYEQRLVEWREGEDKRPLAMVFPRRGFAQGLVLHSGGFEYVPPNAGVHVYRVGGARGFLLIVQPFAGLIDHVVDTIGWTI
jgi:hypothetical protein